MLPPGSELIGAGSSLTTLELFNSVNSVDGESAKYHTVLTGGNRTSGSKVSSANHLKIEGITLECESNLPTIGIQVWTSNAVIQDVIVKNISGNFSTKMEGFGILVNNSGNVNEFDGGHIVRDCKVYSKENSYVTGIYVGCLRRNVPLETSLIENCKSLCYSSSLSNCHAAFGINSNLIVNHCESYGFENVFFNDTGDSYDVQINNGVFRKIGYSFLCLRANYLGWNRKNIKANNCFIQFSDVKYDHVAVVICDDQSPTKDKAKMSNIYVDNSIIENFSGKKFYYGSINGKFIKNVGITNSVLPSVNLGAVIATPATSSGWINNLNKLE
jgi:hypothetical protein